MFGQAVSTNFFDVLRVQPAMGRGFLPDEGRVAGRDAVVVLAHDTWTEQFGADPGLVGQQIRLTGQPFTVVGIAPEGFNGAEFFLAPAFYVPLTMLPALEPDAPPDLLDHRDVRTLWVVGRLAPGATLARADQEVVAIARALQQQHPESNDRRGMLLRWERDARSPSSRRRGDERDPDRAGLCGPTGRLRQRRGPAHEPLTRSDTRDCASTGRRWQSAAADASDDHRNGADCGRGGVTGLALGYAGIASFRQFQIVSDVGVRMSFDLDGRALAVGFVIAAVSVLLSSVDPRMAHGASGRSRTRSGTHRRRPAGRAPWGRHGLVASQIALTLVLLTVALSFYRAFEAQYGRGPGFRTDHLLLTTLDPGLARLDQRQTDAFYERVKERAAAVPRVTAAAVTSFVPFSHGCRKPGGDRPRGP